MTGAGADQVRALVTGFSDEIRQRLDALEASVEAGDADDALQRAHTLKGSARVLALPDLAAAMERLEAAYRERPPRVEAARIAVADARAVTEAALSREEAVAQLGHALRTPLSVVLGFAHLLRDANLGSEARAHADAIVRAAEEIVALVDEATGMPASRDQLSTAAASGVESVTVLCVEDDSASARLAEELLRRIPAVRVVVARTGADAIELAARERPGLVLLDPGLPDLAGVEVLHRLREGPAGAAPVVVVTGETRPERLRELREAGATECLTKPVDAGRLLALVESVRPV